MLSIDQIKYINGRVLGAAQISNRAGLSSASSFFYYTTIYDKISSVFRGIIKNHAFVDGNKRTATIALILMCNKLGLVLKPNNDELFEIIVDIAANSFEVGYISKLLFHIGEWVFFH